MKNNNKGIAFVGSTLPALAVSEKINNYEVNTIVTSELSLVDSFLHLQNDNPSLKIIYLPSNAVLHFFVTLKLLLEFKIFNRKIFIYHEACWPVLDIAIWIIRPNGFFTPQVNMSGFSILTRSDSVKVFKRKRFGSFIAKPMSFIFDIYAQTNDGGKDILYLPVIRSYPKTITCLNDSSLLGSSALPKKFKQTENESNKILFTVGTDAIETHILYDLFKELIILAQFQNYTVHIKDHPNKQVRLNLDLDDVIKLDPTIPVELISEQYKYVVGCGSAALASFDERAISILKLLDMMQYETRQKRIKYLSSLNPNLTYIESIEDFSEFIRN